MSTQIVQKSRFTADALAPADAYDVVEAGQRSAKVSEIVRIADHEILKIGIHATGTVAELVVGATTVQRRLTDAGYRSDVYDKAEQRILQVSERNLTTLADAGQKEVIRQALAMMR